MTSALRASRTSTLPAAWRTALPALLLLLGGVLAVYYDTAKAMVSIWARSDTFAHAFLVTPIVLWLVWRQRGTLASLVPQPCPWLLLPIAVLAFAWLLGDLASVNSVTQLALTSLLVLAVPAVLGLQVAKAIAFPLAFMFFSVPIGEFLLPQLISWTADFTALALRATGIPVYREGNHLAIPSGNWSVVEACSGVRYLIASFMVGTLFAYLNYRSPRRRWIFIAVSLGVPIVANWIRAYLIVLVGHLSGNTLAVGADHLIYGWLFFGFVIGVMYLIGTLWAEPEPSATHRAGTRSSASAIEDRRRPEKFLAIAAASALLAFLPHLLLWRIGSIDDSRSVQLVEIRDPAAGWRLQADRLTDWKPAFGNPAAELTSAYASRDGDVGVYVGYYRAQNYARKLVSSDNKLVASNDPQWALVADGSSQMLQPNGEAVTFRAASLRRAPAPGRAEERIVVWQVYWVADRLTSSDPWAKAYAAWDRLRGKGDDSAIIALYALDEPQGRASRSLESFAQGNLAALIAQLRKSRDAARTHLAANNYPTLWETTR